MIPILTWCMAVLFAFTTIQGNIVIKGEGREYKTNEISCTSCYTYWTACIDWNFHYGACCEYTEGEGLEQCKNKYKYCTTGLT